MVATFLVLISLVFWPIAFLTQWENLDDLEGQVLPVVSQVDLFEIKPAYLNTRTHMRIRFHKNRRCDPKEILVNVVELPGRENKDTIITQRFLKDLGDKKLKSRPVGWNVTGIWEWDLPYTEAIRGSFKITVWHKCHGAWLTPTVMYEGPLALELKD
jgi:hypothetical protein